MPISLAMRRSVGSETPSVWVELMPTRAIPWTACGLACSCNSAMTCSSVIAIHLLIFFTLLLHFSALPPSSLAPPGNPPGELVIAQPLTDLFQPRVCALPFQIGQRFLQGHILAQ